MASSSLTAVQQSAPPSLDLSCDDFYFSLVPNDDADQTSPPVSDAKYAEELQFQEALLSSITTAAAQSSGTPDLPLSTLEIMKMVSAATAAALAQVEVEEVGEKCESSQMFCGICTERKDLDEMFRLDGCGHMFCTVCISRHVETRVQDSIPVVTCPGLNCSASLEFDSCKAFVPLDVLTRWDYVLCQSVIPASEKFYCPYKNCSAMLVNDSGGMIRESECPFCNRLFCAQCNVPWHSGIGCEEFQTLGVDERGREDIMVRDMAKQKSWRRCPSCQFYVDKTEGCLHITCRCKFEFCYACGATWSSTHGGCQ
ncbi:unnamed protein product [Cuscuta epithymum]|uniref:RBR-type E3 ubiquitin transferase n=1 Tax=Cuscuta epithymum TaxID=186058 RepID=A0AAV0CF94_9ASTE|nr:unnamed protein product [Cuscuta epithymum]